MSIGRAPLCYSVTEVPPSHKLQGCHWPLSPDPIPPLLEQQSCSFLGPNWAIVPPPALFSLLSPGAAHNPTALLGPCGFCHLMPDPFLWMRSPLLHRARFLYNCLLVSTKALIPGAECLLWLSHHLVLSESWGHPQVHAAVTFSCPSVIHGTCLPYPLISPWDAA